MVAVPTGVPSARTVALVLAVLGTGVDCDGVTGGVGQRCWRIRIGHFGGYRSTPIRSRASTRISTPGLLRRRCQHYPW
jgi:hypothetical protein